MKIFAIALLFLPLWLEVQKKNLTPDEAAQYMDEAMMPEMREACLQHSPGQIFTVDIPAMNRYYVMVENHEPIKKKAVVVQHKVYEEE